MTRRRLYTWVLAPTLCALVVVSSLHRPADAQAGHFPIFYRGGTPDSLARFDSEFAITGNRNFTVHAGITLSDLDGGGRLRSQSLVVGRGTARRGTFRVGVRNPDGATDAGNRAFGRITGSLEGNDPNDVVISGRADVVPYRSRPFDEARLFRPQDEKANADLQGDWISAFREDGDNFRLTLRGNRLILKGTEVQFGEFEFQGIWSALTDTDGFPLLGLVPTKVRVPVDEVLAFDAANLPDPFFGFIDPDDTDILVIFLARDRITGDFVRTRLRRLDRPGRPAGLARAPGVRSPGLGAAVAAKSRIKFGTHSPGAKP